MPAGNAARKVGIRYVGSATFSQPEATNGNKFPNGSLSGGISANIVAGDFYLLIGAPHPASATVDVDSGGGTPTAVSSTAKTVVEYGIATTSNLVIEMRNPLGSQPTFYAAVHVWRGVDTSTPMDVAVVETNHGTSTPDPASITPVTAGAVILAGGAIDIGAGGVQAMSIPLDNAIGSSGSSAQSVYCVGSYSAWTSGAYNPPSCSWAGTVSDADSFTMALRPKHPS